MIEDKKQPWCADNDRWVGLSSRAYHTMNIARSKVITLSLSCCGSKTSDQLSDTTAGTANPGYMGNGVSDIETIHKFLRAYQQAHPDFHGSALRGPQTAHARPQAKRRYLLLLYQSLESIGTAEQEADVCVLKVE